LIPHLCHAEQSCVDEPGKLKTSCLDTEPGHPASPGDPYAPHSLNKDVALVTGASAGIGEACAFRLAAAGAKVIITGRREGKLKEVADRIRKVVPKAQIHVQSLDLQDTKAVAAFRSRLPTVFQDVTILVNNAGLALGLNAADGTPMEHVSQMMNTNVVGLIAMTSAFVPHMRTRGYGHIINIGSISGHHTYAGGSIYCATKHAVRAYTQTLQQELVATNLRVSLVSPGFVDTEFSTVRFSGDKKKADSVYKGMQPLVAADIADTVHYVATRPSHVQVGEIVVWPRNQAVSVIARDPSPGC